MTNCEQQLAQLRSYQDILRAQVEKMAAELARLFTLTHNDKSILNSARQLLEILLTQYTAKKKRENKKV